LSIWFVWLTLSTDAQLPIAQIIKEGIKKVIIAVDLKIQRLQTKTIWLQNAQTVVKDLFMESLTRAGELKGA
jgi:hypothetical protein